MFISVLTMFMAGVSACFEMDMKKVIALSTLSQLGVMMSSLALGLPFIAFFHLCTHALFNALLFLCAGSFISSCFHVQDFRHLGGLSLQMPLSVCCMNIANLALCGSPFLAGFYSNDLILEGFLFSYSNLFILFLVFFATGLTACYSVRFSLKCLWGVYCSFSFSSISDENPNLVFPLLFLTLGAIFSGSFFSWFLFGGSCFYFFSLFFKLSILFTVFLGFFFGWVLNSFSYFYLNSFYFDSIFFVFSSVLMWFLVFIFSQYFLFSFFNLGFNFLYVLDRGWNEIFGGQGFNYLLSSGSSYLSSFQGSFITIFMSLSLLFCFSFIFFFLYCF